MVSIIFNCFSKQKSEKIEKKVSKSFSRKKKKKISDIMIKDTETFLKLKTKS